MFTDNPIIQGGLLVALGTSLVGMVYKFGGQLFAMLYRMFSVSISARSDTRVYSYLEYFVTDLEYAKNKCSHCNLTFDKSETVVRPSYGFHIFWYKRHFFILNFTVIEKDWHSIETIQLTTFKIFGKRAFIDEIVEKGKQLYENEKYKETKIYIPEEVNWYCCNSRKLAKFPALTSKADELYLSQELDDFLINEEYYRKRGLNYKKGFLFHGPPGNGKTSCIIALAQKYEKHVCMLNLGDDMLTEGKFLRLIANLPKNSILCFEDIDAVRATHTREEPEIPDQKVPKPNQSPINLSGILNLLDGLFTPHGLIFFMTTNHLEKLDPALIRPGRIDVNYEFKNSNHYQVQRIYEQFETKSSFEEMNRLINQSMSHVSQTIRDKEISNKNKKNHLTMETSSVYS